MRYGYHNAGHINVKINIRQQFPVIMVLCPFLLKYPKILVMDMCAGMCMSMQCPQGPQEGVEFFKIRVTADVGLRTNPGSCASAVGALYH